MKKTVKAWAVIFNGKVAEISLTEPRLLSCETHIKGIFTYTVAKEGKP